MNQIIEQIHDAVTRFPNISHAFLSLIATTQAARMQATTGEISMDVVETDVEAACDRIVCAALAEVMLACDPATEGVEIKGKRYRRMPLPSRGIYYARRASPLSTIDRPMLIRNDPIKILNAPGMGCWGG